MVRLLETHTAFINATFFINQFIRENKKVALIKLCVKIKKVALIKLCVKIKKVAFINAVCVKIKKVAFINAVCVKTTAPLFCLQ